MNINKEILEFLYQKGNVKSNIIINHLKSMDGTLDENDLFDYLESISTWKNSNKYKYLLFGSEGTSVVFSITPEGNSEYWRLKEIEKEQEKIREQEKQTNYIKWLNVILSVFLLIQTILSIIEFFCK